jgi:hypothetical protein
MRLFSGSKGPFLRAAAAVRGIFSGDFDAQRRRFSTSILTAGSVFSRLPRPEGGLLSKRDFGDEVLPVAGSVVRPD